MYQDNFKPSEPGCGMGTAVRNFFKNYANFEGRSSVAEYWWVTLANVLVILPLCICLAIAMGNMYKWTYKYDPYWGGKYDYVTNDVAVFWAIIIGILLVLWGLFTFIPSLALTVRRLHDSGKSGWFYLFSFIPFVGGIVVFVFTLLETEPYVNQYGGVAGRDYPVKEEHTAYTVTVAAQPQPQYQPQPQPQSQPEPAKDVAAELTKYAQMLKDGLLTQEEYDTLKKRLLGL